MEKYKKVIIIITFLLLFINVCFANGNSIDSYNAICISKVFCGNYQAYNGEVLNVNKLTNQDLDYLYCQGGIEITNATYGFVLIKILEGGNNQGVKVREILTDNSTVDTFEFFLTKYTAPVYITCYDVIPPMMSRNENTIIINTLDTFSISVRDMYYQQIAGTTQEEFNFPEPTIKLEHKYIEPFNVNVDNTINESAAYKENNNKRILWILTFIGIAILIYINYILTYKNGYSVIFWILNTLIIPSAYIILPSKEFPYLLLATMFCIFIVIIELGKFITKKRF